MVHIKTDLCLKDGKMKMEEEAMKIIHKDQEIISAFAINQVCCHAHLRSIFVTIFSDVISMY